MNTNARISDSINYVHDQDQDQSDQGKYDGANTHVIKCVTLDDVKIAMDVVVEIFIVLAFLSVVHKAVTNVVCYKKFVVYILLCAYR